MRITELITTTLDFGQQVKFLTFTLHHTPPAMNLTDALSELRALADPQHVVIQNRFGVRPGGPFYGVSLTNLKALAKRIKRDHALAVELWRAGCMMRGCWPRMWKSRRK